MPSRTCFVLLAEARAGPVAGELGAHAHAPNPGAAAAAAEEPQDRPSRPSAGDLAVCIA